MTMDYPAAHSMDTNWFAVDEAGQLALFRTGEAGALPSDTCAYERADAVERRLEQLIPPVPPVLDVAGRFGPHSPYGSFGHRAHYADTSVVLLLSSLAPLQEAIAAGRAIPVPATEGFAVLVPRVTREELDAYHRLPELTASFDLFEEDVRQFPSASNWGVFEYEHITENWISGPYGRVTLPGQPLHIDQLPPDVRRMLAGPRLKGVRFTEAHFVQPVEHAECLSWEPAYLDAAFRHIRPIPGKEADYSRAFADYSGAAGKYIVERPPTGEGPDEDE